MAIAWSTLLILGLLIPGLVALFGLYVSDRVSRDVVPQGLLPLLGVLILVAALVHFIAFLFLNQILPRLQLPLQIPLVDLAIVFRVPSIGNGDTTSTMPLVDNMEKYAWWIFLYFLATACAGFLMGRLCGVLIARGPLRPLASHGWLYDGLSTSHRSGGDRTVVSCYVLSNVEYEGVRMMYFGEVYHFQFTAEGKLSYLVLARTHRALLSLKDNKIGTIGVGVGSWPLATRVGPGVEALPRPNLLFIDGEDIANVFFTSAPWQVGDEDMKELENKVKASERGAVPQENAGGEAELTDDRSG